jgi:hypothetical protein
MQELGSFRAEAAALLGVPQTVVSQEKGAPAATSPPR